jgi:copper transport protein
MTWVTLGRRAAAGLPLLLFAAALFLARPPPVSAHAELAQSDPPAQSSLTRAPAQVRLTFTEAIEPNSVQVSVLDRSRNQVSPGNATLVPGSNDTVTLPLGDLPPGVYTISWAVTSAVDGHTTRGLIPFAVGDAGEVPAPLSAEEIGAATSEGSDIQQGPIGVVARWLTLLSMLALGGVLVAYPLLLQPAAARLEAMRSGQDETAVTRDAPEQVEEETLRRARRILWSALALFAAGSLLLLLVDAAASQGDDWGRALSDGITAEFDSRRGVLWIIRAVLAVALAGLLVAGGRNRAWTKLPGYWLTGAGVATAMLLATSLGSHSAAVSSGAIISTTIDWIHLIAGSIWVGGLIFLGLALLPSLGPLGGPARTRLLAVIVPRFSTVALASVGVLILTGLFQVLKLLDPLDAIAEIEWGRALLIKLGLVVVLLGLGAINLLVIRPRLAQYATKMDRASREQAASVRFTFRRVVLAEAAIGAVVVLVVGVLTGVNPSQASIQSPTGPFRPFILDQQAEGLSGRLVLSPGRIGNNRFDLTVEQENGEPLAADASAVLRITTLDQDTGISEARMDTLGPGRFTTAGSYLSTAGLWEITALIRREGRQEVAIPFRLSLSDSTGQPQVEENRPAAPPSRGREIYQQSCAQCHGIAGRGDGPLAAGLRPPPVDLTVHVPLHNDQTLAGWISNGIPRTSMPAFGSQFSSEEIQAVINYLRDLAQQSGQDR